MTQWNRCPPCSRPPECTRRSPPRAARAELLQSLRLYLSDADASRQRTRHKLRRSSPQASRRSATCPATSTALVSFLAIKLGKPVLVEGPAGVGKTELAKALATHLNRTLVRLQCYEGLDEAKALYEWNYRKQLLRIQTEIASRPAGRTCRRTSSARSSSSPGR